MDLHGRKRKKAIHILYFTVMVLAVAFFAYLIRYAKDEMLPWKGNTSFQEVTEFRHVTAEDKDAPVGIKDVYTMQLQEIPQESRDFAFYTIHQNVEVYVGDKLLYKLCPKESNLFGKTPGNNWNLVTVYPEDSGKKIRVELYPVYKASCGIVPDFYIGSKYSIWLEILEQDFLAFFLSFLAIFLGIIFIFLTLFIYRSPQSNRSLFMLGMFAINAGIWKLTDMSLLSLVFQGSIALSAAPFLAIMLVMVPFLQYSRELFSTKDSIWWDLAGICSIAVSLLALALQVMGIADLRETLPANHIALAFVILVFLFMSFREWRTVGWNKQLRILQGCVMLCILGLAVDIFFYYTSNGASIMILGMLGLLTYIAVMGVHSIKEAQRLIAKGVEAKRYERMAFYDQLTGLYNRTAYSEHLDKRHFSPEGCIAVMFDLNNLKKCNDTLGHEKGDRYIRCSADLIQQVFGDIGKCYRMGGDEFCVLLKGVPQEECAKRVQRLKNRVDESNRENPDEFPIQIACGYKIYDSKLDFDLGDTLRRADKMMYHEKFVMKQQASGAPGF
ncbi:MAG: diguanylate cyclase [Lachnospiraceae bacterium]|jgi:diguanylate cyclase (GGDEF)-like protein|nr:diguanylate cyclase [Lachnospiraceae bacterium]